MAEDVTLPDGTERLWTGQEVAAVFRVSQATISRWAKDGKLTRVGPPGSHLRFRDSQVRALLAGTPADPAA
jgi:excisionase family DNA binding protein